MREFAKKTRAANLVKRQMDIASQMASKDLASPHAKMAMERLAKIAEHSSNDAAAVTAAKAILEHTFGKPAAQVQEYKGKKEAATKEAQTAGVGSEWGADLQLLSFGKN